MNIPTPILLTFLEGLHRRQGMACLTEWICSEVPKVFGGENAIVCEHDGARRIITSVVAQHPFSRANLMPYINQSGIMAQHPFWEHVFHPDLQARALSQICGRTAWEESALYREVFAPDGIRDQMNIEVSGTPAQFTTLNLLRSRRGFRGEEIGLFRQMIPHFRLAVENARLFDQELKSKSSLQTSRVAVLNPEGVCLEGNFSVPAEVLAWAAITIPRLNTGLLETRMEPLWRLEDTQKVRYSLHRDFGEGRYLLVARGDATRSCLTARELEVLGWIAEGKSNEIIAQILGVSIHTVKTHLKRIFQKLGVENRTAAVMSVSGNTGYPGSSQSSL